MILDSIYYIMDSIHYTKKILGKKGITIQKRIIPDLQKS